MPPGSEGVGAEGGWVVDTIAEGAAEFFGIVDSFAMGVTIYFFSLSKRLLSYLIFGAYLIFRSATPRSLHITMKSHSPNVYFILGYRVFVLFIFQHGTLILVLITDS